MTNSPEKQAAIRHLRVPVKTALKIVRGGSSPAVECVVVSVARRLIANLNRDELTLLASGVVPESIGDDTITKELEDPTVQTHQLRSRTDRHYRASARGGDLWMRENKGEINATIAKLQSASTDSSQAPLKGSLLKSWKKRVGWRLFRSLSKEEQKACIQKAIDERCAYGFKPILAPYDGPDGDAGLEGDTRTDGGTGTRKSKRKRDSSNLPLKRKQDTAITKAFVDATNKLLDNGSSAPRDKRLAKMLFSEATLKAKISMRKSKQLVPAIGRRRKGITDTTQRPRPPSISDDAMLEEVRTQSVESCRWSAKLNCPKRTLIGSRRRVWNRLSNVKAKIGYRQFCRRTQRGKLGVERAQNRYHYGKNKIAIIIIIYYDYFYE